MDTDQQEQTAPEADEQDQGTPAQTVRVPNVSPHAKSGLDHIVIGANALEPPTTDPEGDVVDEPDPDPMPGGDLDARLAWVSEVEDRDTAVKRADRLYDLYKDDDTVTGLASSLQIAVYGKPAEVVTQEPTGQAIVGEEVKSETADTGDATNAETGETTPGGEPLPPIEQEGGTPLDPPTVEDGQEHGAGAPADESQPDGTVEPVADDSTTTQ